MPLFQEFKTAEIQAVLDLSERIEAGPGELIVKQDSPGDCMFVIVEGTARVVHRSEGKRIELSTLGAGDFFGELSLVDDGPRSADVEAQDRCVLLKFPQGALRALAGVYPGAAFKLLVAVGRVLVSRLRSGNRKYIDSLLAARPAKD